MKPEATPPAAPGAPRDLERATPTPQGERSQPEAASAEKGAAERPHSRPGDVADGKAPGRESD